jgi:Ala-tRNA(Pro) deacylase
MPVKMLKDFLDQQGVRYIATQHSPAYTAQELAHTLHARGAQVAKTVVIELDGKLALAVMPASYRIRWDKFLRAMDTDFIELADEEEFRDRFPGCEVGAMPPFGNLYEMQVYLCEALTNNTEIVFPAGSHSETIRMGLSDYLRLAKPIVMSDGFANPSTSPLLGRKCQGREPTLRDESFLRRA